MRCAVPGVAREGPPHIRRRGHGLCHQSPHIVFDGCSVYRHPAETDLHAVIRASILEDIHKQYVIYQLLKALYFMHTAELIHRDVKPSNLLLNSDCHVKMCDFGLCRSVSEMSSASAPVLTDYVATRWYRGESRISTRPLVNDIVSAC